MQNKQRKAGQGTFGGRMSPPETKVRHVRRPNLDFRGPNLSLARTQFRAQGRLPVPPSPVQTATHAFNPSKTCINTSTSLRELQITLNSNKQAHKTHIKHKGFITLLCTSHANSCLAPFSLYNTHKNSIRTMDQHLPLEEQRLIWSKRKDMEKPSFKSFKLQNLV